MGVEVKQGRRGVSVEGPKFQATSEIGPTTYREGGEKPEQETWAAYQPEVGEEMQAAQARFQAAQSEAPEPVAPRADGGRPFAEVPKSAAKSASKAEEADADEPKQGASKSSAKSGKRK